MEGSKARHVDTVMGVLSAIGPASFAAARLANVADAAHDDGVVRVLGLGAEMARAVDLAMGVVLSPFPIGTRAARAAMAGALVVGATGAVLYSVVRRLLSQCADAPLVRAIVSAIVTASCLAGGPWQLESAAVGGSGLGAFVVLFAVALVARAEADGPKGRMRNWTAACAAAGLAVTYEPLVGLAAAAGLGAFVAATAEGRAGIAAVCKPFGRAAFPFRPLVTAFVAGCIPLAISAVRTRGGGGSVAAAFASAFIRDPVSAGLVVSPARLLGDELGLVVPCLAVGGALLAVVVPNARPLAAALVAIAVIGFGSAWISSPLGPLRFTAPVLTGLAATFGLAAVALQAIVRVVAAARIPFARATAAMIVVLECVFPVEAADATLGRWRPRSAGAVSVWNDLAWGSLPPNCVAIVSDPGVSRRAAVARAEGALRADLVVLALPTRAIPTSGPLADDATLVPLWRDLALRGSPSEASLSSLSASRPVFVAYNPAWGYAIGRHLVPFGLLDTFQPEPRGASDRRRGLDGFAGDRDRLLALTGTDSQLSAASASLLRARVLAMAAGSDRDLTERSLSDWARFRDRE